MKPRHEIQVCDSSTGDGQEHVWQPLFAPPLDARRKADYMAHGHVDYLQCANCGTVAMRDGSASCKPLALSQIFSDSKKREAAIWNAQQERAAEPTRSSRD